MLAGDAAIEEAAKKAGHDVKVAFAPGRMDATQKQTDVASFAVLEPKADGFRNYVGKGLEGCQAELLLDKAQLLTLYRARDDGARRRPARSGRELRAHRSTAFSPSGRRR